MNPTSFSRDFPGLVTWVDNSPKIRFFSFQNTTENEEVLFLCSLSEMEARIFSQILSFINSSSLFGLDSDIKRKKRRKSKLNINQSVPILFSRISSFHIRSSFLSVLLFPRMSSRYVNFGQERTEVVEQSVQQTKLLLTNRFTFFRCRSISNIINGMVMKCAS